MSKQVNMDVVSCKQRKYVLNPASLLSEQKLVNSWQHANMVSNCFNTGKLC